MEKFPSLETMKPLIEEIKISINNNDHNSLKTIFINNVEGYNNESK